MASLNRAEIQGCDLSPFVDLQYSQYLQKVICATASSTCMFVGNHVDTLQGKVWAPTHIISTISDDICEETCDDGVPLSSNIGQREAVEEDWIQCLSNELVENLILIPSRVVQDHGLASLKDFVLTLKSLVYSQEQVDLEKGYLAQVLASEYQHFVVAIDVGSHHEKVTNVRAERIKKHYMVKMWKFKSGNMRLIVPQTSTCHIKFLESLKSSTTWSPHKGDVEQPNSIEQDLELRSACYWSSLVLAGLHACGDLSLTMPKTLLECDEVRAVNSICYCYHLLSEEEFENGRIQYGFPMSCGVRSVNLSLGKGSRDLACQSAERWKSLAKDVGLHNFELQIFCAAFQMVLHKYLPEVGTTSPWLDLSHGLVLLENDPSRPFSKYPYLLQTGTTLVELFGCRSVILMYEALSATMKKSSMFLLVYISSSIKAKRAWGHVWSNHRKKNHIRILEDKDSFEQGVL
ncbi:hypothetical protein GQ457_02G016660 [Hibiscus cannabinus]